MEELATYELQHFFPFSADVYVSLFERVNDTVWPWHFVIVVLLVALWRTERPRWWLVFFWHASLAVAWFYFYGPLAELLWASWVFGLSFVAGAVALGIHALLHWVDRFSSERDPTYYLGVVLFLIGLVGYPLLNLATGRSLAAVEVFGLAPNPTILATIGFVLTLRPIPWWLLIVPVLWSFVATAIGVALGQPLHYTLTIAAPVAIGATIYNRVRGRRKKSGGTAVNSADGDDSRDVR